MGYTPSFTPEYENGWEDLPLETTPITADALNNYDEGIEKIEEYLASDNSQANLADAYDETATYEVGDYVIYGGDLYKCLEDIDEPEEWDSTKWESCLITDEMATSGGTTVIANPSGTATDTLNKLQVENTIYSVEGGGGNANMWTGTQAELEEVFDDLAEGTLVNITDDEQEVVEGGTIYSEDEQVIGLWTDNRPLYQRTYIYEGEIAPNGYISLDADLLSTSVNAFLLINAEYRASSTTGGELLPNRYTNSMGGKIAEISINTANGLYIENLTSLYIRQAKVTVQYTKSTDAPLDLVVGKRSVYIASSDCYSTVEKEIGCWTDGKPLYQKTLIIEPASSDFSVDIASLNIDKLIDRQATLTRTVNGTSNVQQKDAQYRTETASNNNYGLVCELRDNVIQVGISGYLYTEIDEIRVTLQYTKTTDTAGSGSYTPASGKAVHYSTDEQVIGTWIDGSTLYRKVFTIPISNKNTDYNISSMSIDKMINLYGTCGDAHLPLNTVHESSALPYSIGMNYINNTIQIRFGAEQSIRTPCYVVCEYTKATS